MAVGQREQKEEPPEVCNFYNPDKKGTFSFETESIFDYVLGRGIIVVMRPTVRLTGLSYRKDLDIQTKVKYKKLTPQKL